MRIVSQIGRNLRITTTYGQREFLRKNEEPVLDVRREEKRPVDLMNDAVRCLDVALLNLDVVVDGSLEGRELRNFELYTATVTSNAAVVGVKAGSAGVVVAEILVLDGLGEDGVFERLTEPLLAVLLALVVLVVEEVDKVLVMMRGNLADGLVVRSKQSNTARAVVSN